MSSYESQKQVFEQQERVIESQARCIADLQDEKRELLIYIDYAKAACGDHRVAGEPLAEAIKRIVKERDELRAMLTPEQLEEWRRRP